MLIKYEVQYHENVSIKIIQMILIFNEKLSITQGEVIKDNFFT